MRADVMVEINYWLRFEFYCSQQKNEATTNDIFLVKSSELRGSTVRSVTLFLRRTLVQKKRTSLCLNTFGRSGTGYGNQTAQPDHVSDPNFLLLDLLLFW